MLKGRLGLAGARVPHTDRHGLKNLLQELLNVDVSKQQQSSEWGAQDLTEAQKQRWVPGVCSGDLVAALAVSEPAAGSDVAKSIQLMVEYAPSPPFDSGTPESADPVVLKSVREATEPRQRERQALVARAAKKLG